ncbi:unnamed protein product [Lota lota]
MEDGGVACSHLLHVGLRSKRVPLYDFGAPLVSNASQRGEPSAKTQSQHPFTSRQDRCQMEQALGQPGIGVVVLQCSPGLGLLTPRAPGPTQEAP